MISVLFEVDGPADSHALLGKCPHQNQTNLPLQSFILLDFNLQFFILDIIRDKVWFGLQGNIQGFAAKREKLSSGISVVTNIATAATNISLAVAKL